MTAVNVWLSPAKGEILTDTMTVDRSGRPSGFCSKVAIVPRRNAIVAGRNKAPWFLRRWSDWIDGAGSLSVALAGAQEAARHIVAHFMANHRPEYIAEGEDVAEFVTLAWDGGAGRVVGFANLPENDYRTVALTDGTHAFPWMPGYPSPARVPLVDVVRLQLSTAARLGVSPDIGGSLVRAIVTRDGVSTRIEPAAMGCSAFGTAAIKEVHVGG